MQTLFAYFGRKRLFAKLTPVKGKSVRLLLRVAAPVEELNMARIKHSRKKAGVNLEESEEVLLKFLKASRASLMNTRRVGDVLLVTLTGLPEENRVAYANAILEHNLDGRIRPVKDTGA